MNPMSGENFEFEGNQKILHQGSGTIPALADEELMGEDDEYDDLYSDVNVGENFFQAHQPQTSTQVGGVTGNGGLQAQKSNIAEPRMAIGGSSGSNVPGGAIEGMHIAVNGPNIPEVQANKMVPQGSTTVVLNTTDFPRRAVNVPEPLPVPNSYVAAAGPPQGSQQIPVSQMSVNPNVNLAMVNKSPMQVSVENGNTTVFVGELHWWTTDAEIESVLSQYGRVKEIKFFDERASGKSKGYCQVDFYDATAAATCKEGMNGFVFNGRACVVAFASPETLKQMGANFTGRNQGQTQLQNRRPLNEGSVGRGNNMNTQNDNGRNYGRGGFGRGGQGMGNRGAPWSGNAMRGRGLNNAGGGMANGIGANPYGPGLAGPFGGPAAGMMHPQGMMGAGFDPTFMGRGGGYGGFPGLAFPGMAPSFPGVNGMGMVGVAPHVNPAFFGRGMGGSGMGLMGAPGMDGSNTGMWNEASGYGGGGGGEDGGSEYGYEDETQEKEKPNPVATSREKERAPPPPPEREWSENSERRQHRDDREQKRDRYHEEKDSHREYRQRERNSGYDDDRERGQSSSKSRSRSRIAEDDHHRSRSRDGDYPKRRRGD